jgi:DNA-binding GntR family transcriptional regulator
MTPTNADIAYQIIKEKIITIEMPPGSTIQESELMKQLNLGRTPIREALKQLETDKLVVTVPHRGTFVADVQIRDLHQIYEVRVYLEGLCARLAAGRATQAQIAELESCCQKMLKPAQAETRALILVDRQFHRLLAKAAHNRFIAGEVEVFYNLALRLWHLSLHKVTSLDLDTERHFAVLEAIKAGQVSRAEELMKQHIQCFHQAIKSVL